jgi:hypothetical protein
MAKLEERAVAITFTSGPLVGRSLDGIYLSGGKAARGGALIAPPHPLHGASMDSPVVNELAWACCKNELASLRFDWRGVGASAGAASGDPTDADADCACALAYLEETVRGDLVACGYSYGAGAALRTAGRSPRVQRLLLVAPPPDLLGGAPLRSFRGSLLVVTGEADSIAPAGALAPLLAPLPRARLERIPETNHFFGSGLAELGRVCSEWLRRE